MSDRLAKQVASFLTFAGESMQGTGPTTEAVVRALPALAELVEAGDMVRRLAADHGPEKPKPCGSCPSCIAAREGYDEALRRVAESLGVKP